MHALACPREEKIESSWHSLQQQTGDSGLNLISCFRGQTRERFRSLARFGIAKASPRTCHDGFRRTIPYSPPTHAPRAAAPARDLAPRDPPPAHVLPSAWPGHSCPTPVHSPPPSALGVAAPMPDHEASWPGDPSVAVRPCVLRAVHECSLRTLAPGSEKPPRHRLAPRVSKQARSSPSVWPGAPLPATLSSPPTPAPEAGALLPDLPRCPHEDRA